jgi:hypothetical protein
MKKHQSRVLLILLIAAICLAHSLKAVAQVKEEFDNLTFFVPPGLAVNKTNNSMMLTDASSGSQSFSITVNKSIVSFKKIEKGFPQFWRESLMMDGFDNPAAEPQFVKFQSTSGWNCFRGGKLVSYSSQSAPMYYHLTVMRLLGMTTKIITRCSSEELFIQKLPLLMQMVASVEFKKQPPPNTYASNTSNPPPPPPNNSYPPQQQTNTGYNTPGPPLQMNTLYMSVQGDLMATAEIAIYYFLPDGSVYIDIPEKGYNNFNAQDIKGKSPELFGNYTASGNNLQVKMNGEVNGLNYITRPDGALQSSTNTGLVYKKIEQLNNYRFEGTYNKKQESTAINIQFSKDGRFTDNGLIQSVFPGGNGNYAPGSGTYSIFQNTLSLQYNDGRSLQTCMYMMPEDYQQGDRPFKVLVNNFVLIRQ